VFSLDETYADARSALAIRPYVEPISGVSDVSGVVVVDNRRKMSRRDR
jgi:hypothetical protein